MSRYNRLSVQGFMILAMLMSVISCAKSGSVVTSTNDLQGSTVQVFYSPPADRSYTEIGLVTAQTGQTILHDRSAEGMIEKLKQEAAKLGADAIIVQYAKEGTWGLKGGGNTGFDRGNAQAVAIKFN